MPERNELGATLQAATVCLLKPDARNLDRCRMLLRNAVGDLIGMRPDEIPKESLRSLQNRCRSLHHLLQAAHAFHAGAFQAVGLLNGAYAPDGRMTRSAGAGVISVEL